jgi:hypothetical protein
MVAKKRKRRASGKISKLNKRRWTSRQRFLLMIGLFLFVAFVAAGTLILTDSADFLTGAIVTGGNDSGESSEDLSEFSDFSSGGSNFPTSDSADSSSTITGGDGSSGTVVWPSSAPNTHEPSLFETVTYWWEDLIGVDYAKHLNVEKDVISDIYFEIYTPDEIYTNEIYSGEWMRVRFEEPLSSLNHIKLLANVTSGNPIASIYTEDGIMVGGGPIVDGSISGEYNDYFLTFSGESEWFEIQVTNGSIKVDHLVDPPASVILNATSTDNLTNDNLTAYLSGFNPVWTNFTYNWYVDSTLNVSVNSTLSYNILDNSYTSVGEIWQICVVPSNLTNRGSEVCSNSLTITEIVNPSVVLNTPTNNTYYGNAENITFNFIPSEGSYSLSSCALYGNWGGGWHLNVTFANVVDGSPNTTIFSIPTHGTFIWNVKCTDSNSREGWATNNFTLNIANHSVYSSQGNKSFALPHEGVKVLSSYGAGYTKLHDWSINGTSWQEFFVPVEPLGGQFSFDISQNTATPTVSGAVTSSDVASALAGSSFTSYLFERGENDYIKYSGSTSDMKWGVGDNFTYSWWMKKSSSANTEYIFNDQDCFSIIYRGDQGSYDLQIGSSSFGYIYSDAVVDDDNWHHIAVTKSSRKNNLSLWVDGNLEDSITTTGSCSTDDADSYLGSYDNSNTNTYDGYLDHFQVWSVMFTEGQVDNFAAGLYNTTHPTMVNDHQLWKIKTWVSTASAILRARNNPFPSDTMAFGSAIVPTQTENSGNESTDLSGLDSFGLSIVDNFTWDIISIGKFVYANEVDLSQILDLDDVVTFSKLFASVNTSSADTLNRSATITFEDVDCENFDSSSLLYSSQYFERYSGNEASFSTCTDSRCTNITCIDSILSFNVGGFSSYVYGGSSTTFDRTDLISGAEVTIISSGSFNETSSGSVVAESSNITSLNLNADSSSLSWAGFLGNISANLSLGQSNSILYSFGSLNNESRVTIIASAGSDFDWSNFGAGSPDTADTAWGFTSTNVDSITNTFNETGDYFGVQVNQTYLVTYDSSGSPVSGANGFHTSIWGDGGNTTDDHAWSSHVEIGLKDFANESYVEYQMMVPVNSVGSSRTMTYWFYFDIE